MGCWNETCIISNLPIRFGQKVVCIVLLDRVDDEDFTGYPFSNVSIATGTMGDYGDVEDIELSFTAEGDQDNTFSVDEYHNKQYPVLFALKEVWDKTVEFARETYPEPIARTIVNQESPDHIQELRELIDKLSNVMNEMSSPAQEELVQLTRMNTPVHSLVKEWIAVRFFLRKVRKCYVNMNAYSGCQHIELDAHKFLHNTIGDQLVVQDQAFFQDE